MSFLRFVCLSIPFLPVALLLSGLSGSRQVEAAGTVHHIIGTPAAAAAANPSVVKLPVSSSHLGALSSSSSPQERRALQPAEEGPGPGDTGGSGGGAVVIEVWENTSESRCLGVGVYPLSEAFFRGGDSTGFSSNDDGIPHKASTFWIDAFDRTLTVAAVQVKLQVWFESSSRRRVYYRGLVSDTAAQRSEMMSLPHDDDGKENGNHTLLSRHELAALGPLLCGWSDDEAEIICVRKKFFLHALLLSGTCRAEEAKSRDDFGRPGRVRRRQESLRVKKEATVVVLERAHPYSLIVVVLDPVTCVTRLQAEDIQREVSSFLTPGLFSKPSCFFGVILLGSSNPVLCMVLCWCHFVW